MTPIDLPPWARTVGIVAGLIVVFVAALFITQPRAYLARMVEAQIESQTRFAYDATIDRVALRWPLGVRIDGVELRSTTPRAATPGGGPPPRHVTRVDRIKVRAGLLSLLRRRPNVSAAVRIDDGRADVQLRSGADQRDIRLALNDIDVRNLGVVADRVGMPVRGTLRGSVHLATSPAGQVLDGTVDINVLNTSVGPGGLPNTILPADMRQFYAGNIPLPQAVHIGDILLRAGLDDGTITLTDFAFDGNDVRGGATGSITLRQPRPSSTLDLAIRIALSPEFVESAGLGVTLDSIPAVQQAQSNDELAFELRGRLGQPQLTPAGAGARRRVR